MDVLLTIWRFIYQVFRLAKTHILLFRLESSTSLNESHFSQLLSTSITQSANPDSSRQQTDHSLRGPLVTLNRKTIARNLARGCPIYWCLTASS